MAQQVNDMKEDREIQINPTYKELFDIDYDIEHCEDCQLAGDDWFMNKDGDYECACDTCKFKPYQWEKFYERRIDEEQASNSDYASLMDLVNKPPLCEMRVITEDMI